MTLGVYVGLILIPYALGLWAQIKVTTQYGRWSRVRSRGQITGAEAAAAIMRRAGVDGVSIVSVRGSLNDHYDPLNRRLALSETNYNGTSLAALGVAAHEAGHALQHKEGYVPLRWRSALIPITNFASQLLPLVLFGGFFMNLFGLIRWAVWIYLILAVFQLVTLPVEFDASRRARKELVGLGIIDADEERGVGETLDAAAWTYVAAFVATLGNLIYYFLLSRRNEE
jgi:Zn-dependent membrane protease YugP